MNRNSVTLDLQGITTKANLHALFAARLDFPDWYGANWDAFWDCITAVVPMPTELRLVNWQEFAAACPHELDILRRVADNYAREMPGHRLVLVPAAGASPPAPA